MLFTHELSCGAVCAVFCHKFAAILEVQKGVLALVSDKDNTAALAAVSAVGAALSHVLFSVERNAAVSAVTGFYIDITFICEHISDTSFLYFKKRKPSQ